MKSTGIPSPPTRGSNRHMLKLRTSTLQKSMIFNLDEDDTDAYVKWVNDTQSTLRVFETPLTKSEIVMVMQGWNKVLAFKTMFSESLLLKWRISVAITEGIPADEAIDKVEHNVDPIGIALGAAITDGEDIVMDLLDAAFRSYCPHLQTVQREAYRPLQDDRLLRERNCEIGSLECIAVQDNLKFFARRGVTPDCWLSFVDSFIWAMKTHVPYAQEDDRDDFDNPEGAFKKAVVQQVALPAVQSYADLKSEPRTDVYQIGVKRFWARLDDEAKANFGQNFYQTLLEENAVMLDYFLNTDMDSLAAHLMAALSLLVHSTLLIGTSKGSFRKKIDYLGERHRQLSIPTYTYGLVGKHLLGCLQPAFDTEEELTKNERYPSKSSELLKAFATLYTEVFSLVHYPMFVQEKKLAVAREFIDSVATELGWSEAKKTQRILDVEQEISEVGTYNHTSEELETGARLAWRNSAKCIGRIAWKTLMVRDKRHIDKPEDMFEEVQEHLKLATAGTNIQSIMTVFKPRGKASLGTRFWSSQYVRYAAYKDASGAIIGDPANLELTEYLVKNKMWTPPEPKTAYDVLPLVIKAPDRKLPDVFELPKDCIFEVAIEHPTKPEVTSLGYRWTTVPAISNFKMNLGGVVYQSIPFNGWFVTTEIVRNLMERYDAGPDVARACGIDPEKNYMYRQLASSELDVAIGHSFTKSGFTIVDPHAVGASFCTHVRREREQFGRECPAQWSWIGGFVGPTNPTWHLEMRDFLVLPQYEYACEDLLIHTGFTDDEIKGTKKTEDSMRKMVQSTSSSSRKLEAPRVLLAYGSETGNAEAVARRLKRQLALLKPLMMSLEEVIGLDIVAQNRITHVICVCSTFGHGRPPGNAEKFFATKINPDAKIAKFAVLALGSTIYPDFCKAGYTLDKKLESSGLERLIALTKVDEAAGAAKSITDWMGLVGRVLLPPQLEAELVARRATVSTEPAQTVLRWHTEMSTKPVCWPDNKTYLCVSNDPVVVHGQVRKITFALPAGSSYETGDHVSVLPINNDGMVNRFVSCFVYELQGIAKAKITDGTATSSERDILSCCMDLLFDLETTDGGDTTPADVFFKTPTSLRELLKMHFGLSLESKNAINILAVLKSSLDKFMEKVAKCEEQKSEFASDALVQEFADIAGSTLDATPDDASHAIDELIARFPTYVELFEHFKPLFFEDFASQVLGIGSNETICSLAEILVVMPRMKPRYYSISSSSKASPNEVTVTVGVLTTKTSKGVQINGVCSHYLGQLEPGKDRVKLQLVTSSFRLAEETEAPLILVGAGTGLSPMMGFLEERSLDHAKKIPLGKIHLFFGCRTEDDFIYRQKIEKYEADELLDLHLGLSRAPNKPKMYVQSRIKDMGKDLAELLQNPKTHYYVCGDARMAEACFEACVQALRVHGSMSRVWAVQFLKKMRAAGRWQTDVWGIYSHFEDAKKSIETKKRAAARIWLNQLRNDDTDE